MVHTDWHIVLFLNGKHLFKGIDHADSISWDPHKQLGIPIPNSVFFVKNSDDFQRVALHSAYFNRETDTEPNPGVKSPPSTRPFSALPLVCSLRYQGMKKVIERLRIPLETIKSAAEYIKREDMMELVHQPDTGILCFRIVPENVTENKLDILQKFLFEEIMRKGERSIAISEIDNKMVLRIVAISPSVNINAVKETFSDLILLAKTHTI